MRVLHLAMHEGSGAGRAALRLHYGLLENQVNSQVLSVQKGTDIPSVLKVQHPANMAKRLQAKLSVRVLKRGFGCTNTFSVNASPSLIWGQVQQLQYDLINLHWVGYEYIRIEDLRKVKTPLVWTLQDMWPFTGGCHYSGECNRYTASCGACPQLGGQKEIDLSHWVWQRKAKTWEDLNLTIVAPSQWIADCARASSLFREQRIEVIPFCLDTNCYRPMDRQAARATFNLPQDKQIVLFGALSATQDRRKGFHLLLPALQKLSQNGWGDRTELVVFGASEPKEPIDMGFKVYYLGSLSADEALSRAYSCADVMVVPSIQESFGQTASEAMACGTPVVAFDATGPRDIVDHLHNGYLATAYEVDDLAQGIAWILDHTREQDALRHHAREKAERAFSLNVQAQRYQSLYAELLSASTPAAPSSIDVL
jgi:glycosyltransferase involved in cell wall biosynthesis